MLHIKRKVPLVVLSAAVAGAVMLGCAGPQPLSRAMRSAERDSFLPMLRASVTSPKQAYYAWKANQTGQSVALVAKADQSLSATRNPFKAANDPIAVSRGAAIYEVHCMNCHGENLDGRGTFLPHTTPRMSFKRFDNRFAVTLHGGAPRAWFKKLNEGYTSTVKNPDGTHSAMPPFKDVLAREQIWLAVTYLQTIESKAPATQPAS